MTKWGFIIFLSILLLGCSANRTMFAKGYDLNSTFKTPNKNKSHKVYRYKVKIYDRISVLFYDHPKLSTRVIGGLRTDRLGILVNPNGYAIFPLIGKVKVAGLYEDDLTGYLEKKYSKYIKNPQINIHILNKHVIVLGAVKTPGVVKITNETMNLFQALAARGGVTKIGKEDGVIIVRGNLKNPKISLINLTSLNSIRKNNLTLYPGNIAYVTPNINRFIEQGLPASRILYLILNSATAIKTLYPFAL